jgi:hypothetical protein
VQDKTARSCNNKFFFNKTHLFETLNVYLRFETACRFLAVTVLKQFIAYRNKTLTFSHCLVGIRHGALLISSDKLSFRFWRVAIVRPLCWESVPLHSSLLNEYPWYLISGDFTKPCWCSPALICSDTRMKIAFGDLQAHNAMNIYWSTTVSSKKTFILKKKFPEEIFWSLSYCTKIGKQTKNVYPFTRLY